MSLARTWIEAALAADLTQNELKAFLAIFHQTLCYGKRSDAITLKRLATIAHVRADRLTPALRTLLDKGIAEIEQHVIFGQEFFIPKVLLAQENLDCFVPALPKNREPTQKTGEHSTENRVSINTSLNPTSLDITTTPSVQAGGGGFVDEEVKMDLPYPDSFNSAEKQRSANILDGLSPTDARDCLLLLKTAMSNQSIKSPLGYLHGLAKSARSGLLDRSTLPRNTISSSNSTRHAETTNQSSVAAQIDLLMCEVNAINRLYSLAGTEPYPSDVVKLSALHAQIEALKALAEVQA